MPLEDRELEQKNWLGASAHIDFIFFIVEEAESAHLPVVADETLGIEHSLHKKFWHLKAYCTKATQRPLPIGSFPKPLCHQAHSDDRPFKKSG